MFDTINVHIHLAPEGLSATLDNIEDHLHSLSESIIMNQAELTQALVDLKAQADKSKAEIVAKVAALEAAVAAGGAVDPAVEAALADLKGAVQGIDDLNPDAVAGEVVAP